LSYFQTTILKLNNMTRKSIITALLVSVTATVSFAQQQLRSNTHIGFVYPLSTNGVKAPEYDNMVSLHALAGVSHAELAFCASGVASVVRDSARGCVASGVANVIGGNAVGCMAAGLVNVNAKNVKGAQVAGFLNIAKTVNGTQLAGFSNIAIENVNGAQVSGFINTSDTATTQIAGYINVARSTNTQIAGFVNIADNVDGAQIAGFINIARKVKGIQLAGFINIADSSDNPIGLINIVRNGEQALGMSMNEIGTTLVTFRSGGRKLYGILGIGGNFVDDYSAFALQCGLGMHVPVTRSFRFNIEASVTSLSDRWHNTDIRSGIRVMPSIRFGNVELYAGPSFSYTASSDFQGLGRVGYSVWNKESYQYAQDLSIGVEGGIQFHLDSRKLFKKLISEKNTTNE
jgi:hypothetical protein